MPLSSCFPFRRRKDDANAVEERNGKPSRGKKRTPKNGTGKGEQQEQEQEQQQEQAEERGGDTIVVPRWEEGRPAGEEIITKPKPVRVHLRRPSTMGLGYRVGLAYDDRMLAHYNMEDAAHPEKPERLTAIFESLESTGLLDKCELVSAREATIAELACVHSKKHIDNMLLTSKRAKERSSRIALSRKYNSIYFNEASCHAALLAAGSCVELAVKVAKGELGAGAALVRPPGHHAEADAAMGFCLFNNVAVAAHYLVHSQPALGIKKALIVDWDVHHGNGTQHMFWKDPFVLYFSIHRFDYGFFYPTSEDGDMDKIGEGAGKGFNVNVPWQRRGYGDLDYLAVLDHVLLPIARQFSPDMVFVSGGFDSAVDDPLGGCKITPAGYFQMMQRIMSIADGRVVLALEGGYNLTSIAASFSACMKALLGETCEDRLSMELRSSTWTLIKDIRKIHAPFWSSLSSYLPDHPPEHFEVAEDEGLDSAYQDSVSVSEADTEEAEAFAIEYRKSTVDRTFSDEGLDEEHPGDLLSQMRTLDKHEEVRRSSVQLSDVEGITSQMSGINTNGFRGGEDAENQPSTESGTLISTESGTLTWEDLLDQTSKQYRNV